MGKIGKIQEKSKNRRLATISASFYDIHRYMASFQYPITRSNRINAILFNNRGVMGSKMGKNSDLLHFDRFLIFFDFMFFL